MLTAGQRYIGLDLSLSSPGFAVISVSNRSPTLLTARHIKTNAKTTHGQRLSAIQAELIGIIREYRPFAAIVRERGFSAHAATTQALFKVVGVTDLTLAPDGECIEIPPTTVKKTVVGDGKADKQAVADAVRRCLRLPDTFVFRTDDESDAVAVVLAYLMREGLIDT